MPNCFNTVFSRQIVAMSSPVSAGDGGGRKPANTKKPKLTMMAPTGPAQTIMRYFQRSSPSVNIGGVDLMFYRRPSLFASNVVNVC
jgi:hypothetical protein